MKIHKAQWVEFEVELSAGDIRVALEESGTGEQLMYNLNSVANFLKGVPDNLIAKMKPKTKEVIEAFFINQAARYKNTSKPLDGDGE